VLAVRAAQGASPPQQFAVAPTQSIVAGFGGFGAQFNQHLYADLSGPVANVGDLERKVVALGPQFVRVFFNSTDWNSPDRTASFVQTVQLAQRTGAQIDVTWQGGSYAFTAASMPRFADLIATLLLQSDISRLWVTLFNEPNSTKITLAQYEDVYRRLDQELRARGVRERVQFMGGDLVGTPSPSGQTQSDWLSYLAYHMGDLLDAWSVHVYWNFWDSGKIERRLAEVRSIYAGLPDQLRRPVYVTEFGVRGIPTFEGESTTDPGLGLDGTPIASSTIAAFQEGWFMLRATQLGYAGLVKWDCYRAQYDAGTQDYSTIGPASEGWPTRPTYNLLRLLAAATTPTGGHTVQVTGSGVSPTQLVTAYVSPGGNLTVLGLDTRGAAINGFDSTPVAYGIAGLPPSTRFHLVVWNARGDGTNVDVGFVDSDDSGAVTLSAPVDGVFALTDTALPPLAQ